MNINQDSKNYVVILGSKRALDVKICPIVCFNYSQPRMYADDARIGTIISTLAITSTSSLPQASKLTEAFSAQIITSSNCDANLEPDLFHCLENVLIDPQRLYVL